MYSYLEQLDEHEEHDPRKFFRKTNIDKRGAQKSLYKIYLRDKDGKVTGMLDKKEDVKKFIEMFWAKIFKKQSVDKTIIHKWFQTEEWKNICTSK